MSGLQEILGALAAPDEGGKLPPAEPDLSGLLELAGTLLSSEGSAKEPSSGGAPLEMGRMLAAFSALREEDKNICLLKALKPHLSPERAARVDDVIRVMRLVNLLPLLGFGEGGDRKERENGPLE